MTFIVICHIAGTDRMYRIPRDDLDNMRCYDIAETFNPKQYRALNAGFSAGMAFAKFKGASGIVHAGIQVRSDFKTNKVDIDLWTRDYALDGTEKPKSYRKFKDASFHNIDRTDVINGFEIKFVTKNGNMVWKVFSAKEIERLFERK